MFDILKKEEINTERQYNLDLLKALAIIAMIICHPVYRLSFHRVGAEGEFLYQFGSVILGEYLAVAHAFMFAMGVCILYSQKGKPSDLIRRGMRIYVLAYILNFFRYGIYALADGLITGVFREETLYSVFSPDIFQFAGLALVVTGIFRKMKLKETHIFLIGLILSAIVSPLPFADTGNFFKNLLIGHFIMTIDETACFPFCYWYIFVAFGMLFGAVLRRIEDLDRFYGKLLIVSGLVSLVYITASIVFGTKFLSRERMYYAAGTLEAMGLLSIDLFLLSGFHFIVRKTEPSKLSIFIEMSRNVTPIYFIHWCILGFIDSIFGYLLEFSFSYPVMYLIGAGLIVVSFFLARLWRKRKSIKMELIR